MVADIEDITQRTGNFKSFGVFVKMLASSLSESSDAVVLDLLTYDDLLRLKERQSKQPLSEAELAASLSSKCKDGFLLNTRRSQGQQAISHHELCTRIRQVRTSESLSEYLRVHYPLPLSYQEEKDPQMLKKTIQRLRNEIVTLRQQQHNADTSLLEKLKQENQSLREKATYWH